jgi:uncharacterized protein (TIGR00299 family) protein
VIDEPLAALGLAGRYRLELEERRSSGLRGLHLQVHSLEREPPHRHWQALQQLLQQAPLAEPLRRRVLAVFALLAEAEATVHGVPAAQVHFHEVGAIDALVDVVGVCAALLHLGLDSLICTPPPAGHGQVLTAHGPLPLPAPAVLEIARRHAIPLAGSEGFPAAELTTPTGLALAACWASRFGVAPALLPRQVGVGLGSRSLDRPNLLRLVLADAADLTAVADQNQPLQQAAPALQTVVVQQAQIDDASPEDLAFLADQLRQAGALDVFSEAITMKKGRLGQLLSAIAAPEQLPALRQVWWRHSSSLGLREHQQQRWALQRRHQQCDTPLGPVRLKWALQPDGRWRSKIEHDELCALATRHGLALAQVRALIDDLIPPPEDVTP